MFCNLLLGKDITQKLYSLNEQLGAALTTNAISKAASSDHWRHVMTRSLSVDAVDTGTKGHVRSIAYRQAQQNRRNSLVFSDSKFFPVYKYMLLSPVKNIEPNCIYKFLLFTVNIY